jgi:ribose transport system permease protein
MWGYGIVKKIKLSLNQTLIVNSLSILLTLIFAIVIDNFFSFGNIITLIRAISILGILALGMAIVIIGKGIDLSIVAAMATWVTWAVVLTNDGMPFELAILYAFMAAIAMSAVVGFLIAYADVPAIFATLAISSVVYGLGKGYLFELDINTAPSDIQWFNFIGQGNILGIPMPIVVYGILMLIVFLFLRKTNIGRFIYCIGDNTEGSRIAGIPVRPIIILQYVIAAIMAVIAGIISAASVQSVNARLANSSFVYDVLLVVVIGGISLTGGKGGVLNVLSGTILIGVISNALMLLNVPFTHQMIVKGIILLIALIDDTLINPREEQTAQQGDI